ncbi:I78 family peptidase inhibitor [Solilutibacter pythonis]|nr:I78 family peptidase inhibitor [Lysobacter pythonis]
MRIRAPFSILAAACLSACAAAPGRPATASRPTGHCDTARVGQFIGKMADAKTGEQARIAAGARRVRVLGANDPATMDYDDSRLNVLLDERNVVIELTCG